MKMQIYGAQQARRNLPTRKSKDHKQRGGKSLIIAGSQGMWGAAILAAKACARSGAGYIYLLPQSKQFPVAKYPDFLMFQPQQKIDTFSAVALGPGFKDHRTLLKWINKFRQHPEIPAVVDAEALNAIALLKKPIQLPAHWILTPHEGELARLLNVSSQLIQKNRKHYLVMAQKRFGCIVLLKGYKTLVADSERVIQIKSGNPALAKAGTGDVLTGMITGFLSQKMSSLQAACLAAYVHGAIADDWIRTKKDLLSLMASDLIEELPRSLYRLRPKSQLKAF